jgi:hypothetical protein
MMMVTVMMLITSLCVLMMPDFAGPACPPLMTSPLGPCAHLRTPQDCLAYPTNECFWGESDSRHMEPRTRSMIPLGEGEWLLQRVVMMTRDDLWLTSGGCACVADTDDNRCESRGTEGPCSNLPQQQCQQKADVCWWDAVDSRCEKNRGGCSGLPQPACGQRQECFCEWQAFSQWS